MKKEGWIMIIGWAILMGCRDHKSPLNEEKVNKLGKKFDSAAEKLWDSTKEKGKELGKDLKNRVDSVKLK